MPLFNIRCDSCGFSARRIVKQFSDISLVCSCGQELRRDTTGPSTQTKEILDDGFMPRSIERLADADYLIKERVRTADPLAGTSNKSRSQS
jgi:hypothetical protein